MPPDRAILVEAAAGSRPEPRALEAIVTSLSTLLPRWTAVALGLALAGCSDQTGIVFLDLTLAAEGLASALPRPPLSTKSRAPAPASIQGLYLGPTARHACLIDQHEDLRCWGENRRGQLGTRASLRPELTPTPVPDLPPAAQAALGRDHTCALLRDGSIRCFGGAEAPHARADASGRVDYNRNRELGEIKELVAGADFTCARSAAGEVFCWGRAPGEIEPVTEPKRVADLEATSIAASSGSLCATRPSGKVACWGDNRGKNIHSKGPAYVERPTDVEDISAASSVALGGAGACALVTSGEVLCWGGSDSWAGTPSPEWNLRNAVALTGGGPRGHFCALRSTGKARCWGDGSTGANGQKYRGSIDLDGDFLSVHAGADFTCARRAQGGVECWGANDAGQLAQAFVDAVPNPVVLAGAAGAIAIDAAETGTCAVLSDKTVRCFGPNPEEPLSEDASPRDKVAVTRADGLRMGGSIQCALTDDLPTCWGDNRASQIITMDPGAFGPSTFASLGGLLALAIGPTHACSIAKGGAVTCWGGLGKTRAVPTPVTGLTGAAALALGEGEGCALLDEGTVACFPLRDPAAGEPARPRFAAAKVPGTRGAVAIAHGKRHACAIDVRGAVVCWGSGGSLELGRDEVKPDGEPLGAAVVAGVDEAVELALGDDFSCARRRDGTAWCWGRNDRGQLGDGSFADRARPRAVPGLADVISLRAGSGHACALTRAKEVLCWGDNRMRQIREGAALISTTGVMVSTAASESGQAAP